jgi:hypothetical protein
MVDDELRAARRLAYALEKLNGAIVLLATGPGDVRSRLALAAAFWPLQTLRSFGVPVQVQSDFDWVVTRLTLRPPTLTQGSLEASLRRMQNRTGSAIARRIVAIWQTLNELDRAQNRPT